LYRAGGERLCPLSSSLAAKHRRSERIQTLTDDLATERRSNSSGDAEFNVMESAQSRRAPFSDPE